VRVENRERLAVEGVDEAAADVQFVRNANPVRLRERGRQLEFDRIHR
jgi:hypothetical protein